MSAKVVEGSREHATAVTMTFSNMLQQ